MNRSFHAIALATLVVVAASPPLAAQDSLAEQAAAWGFDTSAFDSAALVGDSEALLLRAPDPALDRLFQAVHATAQVPAEASALCAALDPQSGRGLEGLQAAAGQLGAASRERFALALTEVVLAAAQHPPQPFDEPLAQQSLKSAGVTAALLHDDFLAGLNGDDRDARCRSVRQLLDGLQTRPMHERAAATRLLLRAGLKQLSL